MARKKAGKVMILPKGDWNASVAYTMLDLVHVPNSATYLAIKDVPAGTAVTNTTYWQEICNTTGIHGDIANTYSASATYDVGDYVMYDGILYICTTAITSGEAWNSAHWKKAVLADDVSALKSQIDNTSGPTYNLFNIDTTVVGALLTSGGIGGTDPTSFWTSDFIEVNKESFVISWATAPSDNYVRIGYYNDEKTFITRQLVNITGLNNLIRNPAYKYIRISFKNDVESVMLEKGTEPSNYAPYTGPIDYVARKKLDNLIPSNKVIAFLGDSLTAGSGTDIVYHMFIAERFGWTCKNYGYGGSGYAMSYDGTSGLMATGESGKGVAITSDTKIIPNNFESRITTVDTNVDALVIFGGTNDWGNGGETITVSDFETAVRNTLSYAKSNFGRIPIIVLLPVHRQNDTIPNGQGKTLKEYAEIIKNICIEMGVYYIDLMAKSGLYPDNQTNANLFFTRDDTGRIDGIHPNHYAHKNISNACSSVLANMLH